MASQRLKVKLFIGERPFDGLSEDEKVELSQKLVDRMGNALDDYYSFHIDEYQKVEGIQEEGGTITWMK